MLYTADGPLVKVCVCVFGSCIVYPYCNDAAERSVPERSVPKTSKESDGTARKYIYALQRAILITTTEEVDSMGRQLTHKTNDSFCR